MNTRDNDGRPERTAMTPVLVVTGPTASGKSGLALRLAEELGAVVINADSMQVYRELEILTARPGADDLARTPHRLYGVLSGAEACSAGRWRDLALAEIRDAHARDSLPLLVGGTGLYLRALERGLARLPVIPEAVRCAARDRCAALGAAAFHAGLASRDPVMGARLHPADRQRVVRAWEVLEASGRSLAAWQAEDGGELSPYEYRYIVLMPPRDRLYAGCNGRFEAMMQRGALAEVEALMALDLDPGLPIMKALGVAPLAAHLRGEISREEAVRQAQQATRRYAKRQLTWLRTQLLDRAAPGQLSSSGRASEGPAQGNDTAHLVIESQFSESFEPKNFKNIRDFVLTT